MARSTRVVIKFIRTDTQTALARSTRLVILTKNLYIYFIRSETLPSSFYILSNESSIPFDPTSNGAFSLTYLIFYFDFSSDDSYMI